MKLNRFIIKYLKIILCFFACFLISCKKTIKISKKEKYLTIDSLLSDSGLYSDTELDSLELKWVT